MCPVRKCDVPRSEKGTDQSLSSGAEREREEKEGRRERQREREREREREKERNEMIKGGPFPKW